MGGACGTYGERRRVYRLLVGKPEGKRPLGKCRHRWEENIKMIFRKWDEGMDWNDLAQVIAGSCECGNMWGISCLAENLSSSQEGLCTME
jgi:hypothetical protein